MKLDEDYKFRDDLKEDTVPIELLVGIYKGVTFRYTQVGIKENDNSTATLKFQYELYDMGNHTETALRKDVVFEQTLGLILNSIILDVAEADNDEHRKNDTEELIEE